MNENKRASWLRSIAREPLLQFLAIGAAIFAAFALFGSGAGRSSEQMRIDVDDATVARLAALYRKQFGSAPEADRLQNLIETYIREEVLYREALRLHLDENDEIVRRRLVQKMEFLAARSASEPSTDELRKYYEAHRDQYKQPVRVSFSHLYFSPDKGGAQQAQARAKQALVALRASKPATGDVFALPMQYAQLSRVDAAQVFGTTELVDALFTSREGEWSGPYASGYGWHLVKISARTAEALTSFDAVIDQVKTDYQRDSAESASQTVIAEMTARYQIVRTAKQAAP